jgi:hypothetical protein
MSSFIEWLQIREGGFKHPPEIYPQIVVLARQREPLLSASQIASQLGLTQNIVVKYLRKNLSPEEQQFRHQELRKRGQEQFVASAGARWADPEYRAKIQNSIQQNWADPEYRAKMSTGAKLQWTDPEYKAQRINSYQQKLDDPEYAYRAKAAQRQQDRWTDPAFRERMTKFSQDRWNDPSFREKMMDLFQTPEHRAKMPQWSNYWQWLASFPLEKRTQIIIAMMRNEKNQTPEDRERMIAAMLAKAATLDTTPTDPGDYSPDNQS